MNLDALPTKSSDVLEIPDAEVAHTIRGLVTHRRLSGLVSGIHKDMRSPDPKLREQAHAALLHLGFPD